MFSSLCKCLEHVFGAVIEVHKSYMDRVAKEMNIALSKKKKLRKRNPLNSVEILSEYIYVFLSLLFDKNPYERLN